MVRRHSLVAFIVVHHVVMVVVVALVPPTVVHVHHADVQERVMQVLGAHDS